MLILLPLILDEIDVSILKSLLEDGRKSFRKISRDTGITTPTVKARYERLVNVGFIKGVVPIFDFERTSSNQPEDKNLDKIQEIKEKVNKKSVELGKNKNNVLEKELDIIEEKISSGINIKIVCDLCKGLIYAKPKILKFANLERFFCCTSCKSGYIEKYRGRIESIKRKYEGKSEIDF